MTSIDELFKKSGLPSKRKFEPVRDPNEIYKSAKLSSSGSSSRHARVEDDDDIEAGPAPPPEGDDEEGDYGPSAPPDDEDDGDDEEGRFFGGGITKAEANILDYVDGHDGGPESKTAAAAAIPEGPAPPPETFDAAWLRKTALNFEKRINRNAQLRARYESDPIKFIGSEADLDADIKALSILGEHPDLYPEFAHLGTVGSLVSLLAHDNTDIAIAAIEIIGELTDEDVDATDAQWTALVDALLEADLVGLLVSNLGRLNEDADEADRTGVYYALGIVENLCASRSTKAAEALGNSAALLKWLLQRAQKKEDNSAAAAGNGVSQNRQYAAEILAILAQASPVNCRKLIAVDDSGATPNLDAVTTLLTLAAEYRRVNPEKGGDEEEYMENLFQVLTCIVDEPEGKTKFLEAEGIELCLLILNESGKRKSRAPTLRLLVHLATGPAATTACEQLVELGGIKTLFTLFMKGDSGSSSKHKHKKHKEKQAAPLSGPLVEQLLDIFASMLQRLPGEAPARIRLLAKFVEKDFAKLDRILALRWEYAARVAAVDRQIAREKDANENEEQQLDDDEKAALADDRFSQRLDAGLFTLQTIDLILAWLVAENTGSSGKIKEALAAHDETFALLGQSLKDRLDGIDPDIEGSQDTQDMLTVLMECLASAEKSI